MNQLTKGVNHERNLSLLPMPNVRMGNQSSADDWGSIKEMPDVSKRQTYLCDEQEGG